MNHIKIGIALPNSGAHADARRLVDLAVEIERLGFDSVWTLDRWLRPLDPVAMPGMPEPAMMPPSYSTVLDPIDLLCAVAAVTERLWLGTSAVNALYHSPVLLARRYATLDHLSSGRAIAGVTSGWMEPEFVAAGRVLPPDALAEHVAAMRAVWGPDPVAFAGEHFEIPPSDIGPKPVQAAIPVLVGYATDAGIERAARIADGLHPFRQDLDRLGDDIDRFRRHARAAGRDPSSLQVVARFAAHLEPNPGRPFAGPVGTWMEDLEALAALGVNHAVIQVAGDLDGTIAVITELARITGRS
ncbi:MAG: TIGR03619 family F420-dependent LLM class oxidoreductase [Actinomycetes bacterium]